jgi:hypothetical protein
MTRQGKCKFIWGNSSAIINDCDATDAPGFKANLNRLGTCVDRILHELLEHRGWSLNYLASCDLANE